MKDRKKEERENQSCGRPYLLPWAVVQPRFESISSRFSSSSNTWNHPWTMVVVCGYTRCHCSIDLSTSILVDLGHAKHLERSIHKLKLLFFAKTLWNIGQNAHCCIIFGLFGHYWFGLIYVCDLRLFSWIWIGHEYYENLLWMIEIILLGYC